MPSDDVVRAFQGLGFGYLLLDNLFEAADHVRLLDAAGFWADVTAAVECVSRSDPEYRTHLKAAAEKLHQAREQIHSQADALARLRATRSEEPRSTVARVARGRVAGLRRGQRRDLRAHSPSRHRSGSRELRAKFQPNLPSAVDLCCGSFRDREDALCRPSRSGGICMPARAAIKNLFGIEPAVYARKMSAFHPQLPGWLHHLGYKHAVLISQDGALIPTIRSTAVNWPSPDGHAIDAFCREPLPASDPLTFFNIVYHMHQAYGSDAAPTVALVHKGEPAFDSYRDLLALNELLPGLRRVHEPDAILHRRDERRLHRRATARRVLLRLPRRSRDEPEASKARSRAFRDIIACAAGSIRRTHSRRLHRSVTPNPGVEEEKLLRELEEVERGDRMRGVNVRRSRKEPTRCADRLVPLEVGVGEETRRAASDAIGRRTTGVARVQSVRLHAPRRAGNQRLPGPIPVADPVKAAEFSRQCRAARGRGSAARLRLVAAKRPGRHAAAASRG